MIYMALTNLLVGGHYVFFLLCLVIWLMEYDVDRLDVVAQIMVDLPAYWLFNILHKLLMTV